MRQRENGEEARAAALGGAIGSQATIMRPPRAPSNRTGGSQGFMVDPASVTVETIERSAASFATATR
jgi:hypothetical protein